MIILCNHFQLPLFRNSRRRFTLLLFTNGIAPRLCERLQLPPAGSGQVQLEIHGYTCSTSRLLWGMTVTLLPDGGTVREVMTVTEVHTGGFNKVGSLRIIQFNHTRVQVLWFHFFQTDKKSPKCDNTLDAFQNPADLILPA